ncbi:MAG: TlpA family protein disulfide reductase [Sediminibacterium sp.]|nr:TlpA family protein disulfide reductase [Sediminibacterium sp.]
MKRIGLVIFGTLIVLTFLVYYYSTINFKGNEQIKIVNSSNLKSFADILKISELKGKIVYIDVWGTFCGPCIKEFEYGMDLKNRFKNNSVAFLYLASPYGRADDEFRWKKMIQSKSLYGYHLLMTNTLYENFWNSFKDSIPMSYQIPHYIIVGRNGRILNYNAPRPSSKTILYEQIERALKQ